MPALLADVGFSNRPFKVKRFQTIHHYSVDVAHGLVLLFGIGTRGPSIMGFETRWNNLSGPLGGARVSFYWINAARFSCCCCGLFSGPAELGALNPYAVHNHGQPTRQRHDRLLILRCLAIFIAHALSQDHFATRTSMLWAAS